MHSEIKEYKPSPRCMRYSYAILAMMFDCGCASFILGHLRLYLGDGNVALLTVLYNIIAIGSRCLFSLIADRVSEKHSGVRIGIMIAVMGFVLPVKFGITVKVVLLALGNAIFHAFAASSVLSRSSFEPYDIGLYCAGTSLGMDIARFGQYWGFFALPIAMMIATASDRVSGTKESPDSVPDKIISAKLRYVFIPLILFAVIISGIACCGISFDVINNKKLLLISFICAALGRIIGGIASKKINHLLLIFVSLVGGFAVITFTELSVITSFAAVFLLNISLPVIFTDFYRLMPRWAGLSYSLITCVFYLGNELPNVFEWLSDESLLAISTGIILLVFSLLHLLSSNKAVKG